MKILFIDYGTKNIVIALSDSEAKFAGEQPILNNIGIERVIASLDELIQTQKIGHVVLGFPFSPEKSDNEVTNDIRRIKNYFTKNNVPVSLWDESYSSVQVESHFRGKQQKNSDSKVARLLLQEYLDNINSNKQL